MTVAFYARRLAPIEYRHRGRTGPVLLFAKTLHAALYGLPPQDEPLPTALDDLLLHEATSPEEEAAVLQQVAGQIRTAAEIIKTSRYEARSRLAPDVAEQLADAQSQTEQIAQVLDRLVPALRHQPATGSTRDAQAAPDRSTAPPALPNPAPAPAPRHR
ncbi:hypothetical protein ACFY1V_13145 [Streptomyces sp. NPDC001255]|uniref:hypothetical protein n=1 Tax=Streptomyces sp. NPDC001255 TaxID=3364550 RepID=UPI00369C08B3